LSRPIRRLPSRTHGAMVRFEDRTIRDLLNRISRTDRTHRAYDGIGRLARGFYKKYKIEVAATVARSLDGTPRDSRIVPAILRAEGQGAPRKARRITRRGSHGSSGHRPAG